MKEIFKTKESQSCYISKFIRENTNLEKKCQFCGKPAQIKNNYKDPYMIQLVCRKCKIEHKDLDVQGMIYEIPLIDCRDYIVKEATLKNNIKLNKEHIKKIKYILSSDFTKEKALDYLGLTEVTYRKLIKQYKEQVDPNIESKLKNVYKFNRDRIVVSAKLKTTINHDCNNNLSKLKYERHLSNNDIIRLSGNTISKATLACTQEGKSHPTIKTKCILAEVFKLSITDIFPEDTEYSKIYCFDDYRKLNDDLRLRLKEETKKSSLNYLATKININQPRLYNFYTNQVMLKHDEIKLLNEYFNRRK